MRSITKQLVDNQSKAWKYLKSSNRSSSGTLQFEGQIFGEGLELGIAWRVRNPNWKKRLQVKRKSSTVSH